ncbi:hypothetical protein GWI33_010634 [Rhynchophorus ferrugineus]|uniref:Mariner transposase n=1 Tax=Rhynchophorus ferrugineus TaxID=354439 RepID=A0A834J1T0_RHYFE|nr:hypothetical protein GWI33_010634 [Rhynchophorus ferrugineus]
MGKRNSRLARLWRLYFWDAHGIIFIDYLEKERTINNNYYIALLNRLNDEITEKGPHLKKNNVFHLGGFELLPHPPCSSELAHSDYMLFSDFKRMLARNKFSSNEKMIAETEANFEAKGKSYYKNVV